MADIKPESQKLTLKRLEQRLAEAIFQLSRIEVRKLELERDMEITQENEKATIETAEKIRVELDDFKKTL